MRPRDFVCTLLFCFTVLSFCILPAAAADSDVCGANAVWHFDETSGTLTISGTGAMWDIAAWNIAAETSLSFDDGGPAGIAYAETLACQPAATHAMPWKNICGEVKTVVIDEGITTVGNFAFADYSNLTAVTLPSTLTSVGDGAFLRCFALREIVLPDALESIGDFAFYSANLPKIHIPREMREIGAFSLCGDGFGEVGYLLETITVDPDNAYFRTVDNMLFTKDGTELVYCPYLAESTVCTLPDTVQVIRDFAALYISAADFVLPDGLREIGRGNFAESSLRSIRVPASVEKIGEYAFTGGFALKRIDVAPENRYYQSIDGVLYTKDGTELLACPPRKWGYLCLPETVQILRGGAFLNSSLSELRFTGNSLTGIERNAFCHCMYLRKLWFPASLQWMEEGSVQKNPALREIYFFGDVPRTVRSDGTDASYFSAISAFDMPANVYYLPEKHGFDTFEGALLNPIPVDEITVDPIQSCGDGAIWWYSENSAAEGELTIRGEGAIYDYTDTEAPWHELRDRINVVYIAEDITAIGAGVLQDLPNARDVCLWDTVVAIGDGNFCDMPSLVAVEIPESVAKIGSGCFENVPALTELTVADGNTHYRAENGELVCLDPTLETETETAVEAESETEAASERGSVPAVETKPGKQHTIWYILCAAILLGGAAGIVVFIRRRKKRS